MEIQDQDHQDQVMIQEEQISGGSQSAARPCKCPLCSLSFKNVRALGGHMRIHKQHQKGKRKTRSSNKIQALDIPEMTFPTRVRSPRVALSTTEEGGGDRKEKAEMMQSPSSSNKMDVDIPRTSTTPTPARYGTTEVEAAKTILSFRHGPGVLELDVDQLMLLGQEPQNSNPSPAPTGSSTHFF